MEEKLKSEGWSFAEHEGLIQHLGGLWHREHEGQTATGFISREFHVNRNGVVHGGMMMALMDRAFGVAARRAAETQRSATISLSYQFLGPLKLGSFAWVVPRVKKVTGRMVFLDGDLICDGECVLQAQGVWRIIRKEVL